MPTRPTGSQVQVSLPMIPDLIGFIDEAVEAVRKKEVRTKGKAVTNRSVFLRLAGVELAQKVGVKIPLHLIEEMIYGPKRDGVGGRPKQRRSAALRQGGSDEDVISAAEKAAIVAAAERQVEKDSRPIVARPRRRTSVP